MSPPPPNKHHRIMDSGQQQQPYMSRKQEKEQLRRQRMRRAMNALKELLFQWEHSELEKNSKLEDADVLEGAIRMLTHLLVKNAQQHQQIQQFQIQLAQQSRIVSNQQMLYSAALLSLANPSAIQYAAATTGCMNIAQSFGRPTEQPQHPSPNPNPSIRPNILSISSNINSSQISGKNCALGSQNGGGREWSDEEEEEDEVDVEGGGGMESPSGTTMTRGQRQKEEEGLREEEEEEEKEEEEEEKAGEDSGICIDDLDHSTDAGGGDQRAAAPGKMRREKRKSPHILWKPYTLPTKFGQ